jgi:hypothetical protein
MCENGHNFCDGCRESLSECPTCTASFINGRNVVLEKFSATAVYPCRNREAGCEETFTFDDKGSHLAVCLFQSRECPLKKISEIDCPWTGILSEIPDHILAEHDSEAAEVPTHFKVVLLDFVEGYRYRRFVICLGELFCLTWVREGDILSFEVFHFGSENETNDFKYGIKAGNSEYCVSVTRKCHSYLDGDFTELQNRDCAPLYYNTVLYCLDENGYLPCEIEIGNGKLDGFVSGELQEDLPVAFAFGSEN